MCSFYAGYREMGETKACSASQSRKQATKQYPSGTCICLLPTGILNVLQCYLGVSNAPGPEPVHKASCYEEGCCWCEGDGVARVDCRHAVAVEAVEAVPAVEQYKDNVQRRQ
jgi:hypothetical protein